jgi:flagella basal body P-ring formation protein FlgA
MKRLLWAAGLLVLFQIPAYAEVTVRLYDLVFVTGGRVILGEIAELKGDPLAVDRLSELQIGPVMKRRESRVVTIEEIKRVLPPDVAVRFTGAPAVEVRPGSPPGVFCDINPALQRHYALVGGDSITVDLRCLDPAQGIDPFGAYPVQYAIISNNFSGTGTQVAVLERRDAAGEVQRLYCLVDLRLYARLAFAAQPIPRGRVIRTEDLVIRTVDLKEMGLAGLMFQPARAVGMEADRHLTPDMPLRWDHLRTPAVVRKGDGVDLMVARDNLQVRTSATALQAGAPGDRIWVRIEDSGKRLRAVVVDGKCVALEN